MATQEEVARHINVSERAFRNLTKLAGSPKPRGRAGYDVDAWRLFYIDVLRQKVQPGQPLNKPANEPANEGGEQDEDIEREIRLQEARIRLTEAQALAQELKNLRDERVVVDTAFCSFALSRLANDIASILDSIPLSMQRRFVDIDKAQLEFLKKLIAKAMNNATATSGKIPEMLDEYIDSTS